MKTHIIAAVVLPLLVSCGGNHVRTVIARSDTAVVDTKYGKVVGYVDDGIFIYKGIPYAKAERFMPPEEPDSWEGVRESRAYGPCCPQQFREGWLFDEQAFFYGWDDGFPGEDCLRVNIWTPGINDGKKRPVMVWFHGGGFAWGSGQALPSYDGRNLANKKDVVLITVNHRLNVLGHLDLSAYGEKYKYSANAGILDLVAALKWVKENIEGFGGDPDNVTVFGQSGGGGKVSTLLTMPSAAGLFHKAIVESGSFQTTMVTKDSQMIAAELLDILGLKPSEVDRLTTVPYAELLAAGTQAVEAASAKADAEGEKSGAFLFGWAPTVDGDLLPYQPSDPRAWEQSKDIPMIIGTNLHEFGISVFTPKMRNLTMEQAMGMVRAKYRDKTDAYMEAFTSVFPEYTPNDLLDVDLSFREMAVNQATLKANVGGAPAYLYLFEWESPIFDGGLRACHNMEIPFVFDNVERHATSTGGGKDAVKLAKNMSAAWANFARTGDPNAKGLPHWEPYSEGGATMHFNNKCHIEHDYDKPLLDFVRDFYVN